MRKLVAIGTLAAMALGAQAASAEGLSYNLIEGSYAFQDLEGTDVDGFGVKGSAELTSNLHAFGSLQNLSADGGGDIDFLSLGVGFDWPVSPAFDVYAGGSFERIKADFGGSESGWGLTGGVRGRVAGSLELGASLKYSDVGDFGNVTTWTAGGRWYFTPNFAVGADYSSSDLDDADATLDGFVVSLRYDFGNRL